MTWDPWTALRERAHLTFGIVALPSRLGGAVYVPRRGGGVILLDRALGQRERRWALAHELVHEERGGGADRPGMPGTWRPVVARDERQTDAEAIRRLVPLGELAPWCAARVTTGDPVLPADVADEWEVPIEVARMALKRLAGGRPNLDPQEHRP
jgi:hypothetical protein